MRGFSSRPHSPIICPSETGGVRLVDPALPAAEHLVGPAAIDVLRLPVEAAGGHLVDVRPVHVQFRPGSDVVVRYSARVSWVAQPPVRETLVASSTVHGVHPGTVLVTADTSDGPIDIGVWRWPFDPVLAGLDGVVSARSVGELLGLDPHLVDIDVVAYRPTERAVVKVSSATGAGGEPTVQAFIKVVAPSVVAGIAERHRILLAAGVPAPSVTLMDEQRGLLVLEPLRGPTLRDLIKGRPGTWPNCEEFDRLAAGFAAVELVAPPVRSKLADGAMHARMLAEVLPSQQLVLTELAERFEAAVVPDADVIVHGDLHEAQLTVADGRIVGVLDIDDVGPGAAVDDRANLIARFLYRVENNEPGASAIAEYADTIRSASLRHFDRDDLDLHTAACLVGLATGPFRLQSSGWRQTVTQLVDRAHRLTMRELSGSPHRDLTARCAP